MKKCCICKEPFEPRNYPGKSIKMPWCSFNCGYTHSQNLLKANKKIKLENEKVEVVKTTMSQAEKHERKVASWKKSEWEAELQKLINEIARIIDFGLPCIAREQHGQIHGGHFNSVGAHFVVRFNLHNIHRQCSQSNKWKHGDRELYEVGLIRDYGQEYFEFVSELPLKYKQGNLWTKEEVIETIVKARVIRNNFKKEIKEIQPSKKRIELREWVNKELKLYF
jgi:hypothetical protein